MGRELAGVERGAYCRLADAQRVETPTPLVPESAPALVYWLLMPPTQVLITGY